MSLVTERCEKCKYKGEVMFWEPCCDYILIAQQAMNVISTRKRNLILPLDIS